ncbi:50S ribosomal protein L10 [Persephonella sp.]|uniref:50S ribosomal protein L10 n=1 Tax=Persephonella sp. TaxID=2060922 RepID=UPI002624B058|nr:50S ribosomal protein L10 [Persephonella sp.]
MSATEVRKAIQKKQQLVNEVKEKIDRAKLMVVFDFTGIDANSMADFRKEIRKKDAEIKVIKNSILYRACNGTELYDKIDIFQGPSAVIFAYEDIVTAAKALKEFLKNNESAKVKAGLVEGAFATPEKIDELASLPSREELLAQLFATMMAPVTNFVRVLNAVPQKAVMVLNAIKEEKEKQG